MVPLKLFRSGSFSGANLVTLFLYAALGIFVRGEREYLFLRIGQVLDSAGQECLGRGDHVQRLAHQLDQAVLGHETGSKLLP